MSHPEQYNVVILGSGAAGKLLAWTLGSQGKRVAVVERRYVGGSCPNMACLRSHGHRPDCDAGRHAVHGDP